uniref:Uncharacterized protein n=1 Tax=Anguilla anguilla TaxID=7936 RepID=A0A0E9WT31_ANGAN
MALLLLKWNGFLQISTLHCGKLHINIPLNKVRVQNKRKRLFFSSLYEKGSFTVSVPVPKHVAASQFFLWFSYRCCLLNFSKLHSLLSFSFPL